MANNFPMNGQQNWFQNGQPFQADREAFQAGWNAAQRQMNTGNPGRAFSQGMQAVPQQNPTFLPGRVVNSPDDIRPNETPMDGTVAAFPLSDYSYVILKAWNANGRLMTEVYKRVVPEEANSTEGQEEDPFKKEVRDRFDRLESLLKGGNKNFNNGKKKFYPNNNQNGSTEEVKPDE